MQCVALVIAREGHLRGRCWMPVAEAAVKVCGVAAGDAAGV